MPSAHEPPSSPVGAHWRLVGRFLRPRRRALLGLGAVMLVAGSLPLLGPILLGAIADGVTTDISVTDLLLLATAFAAVGLAANGGDLLVAWLGARLAWTAANDLRVEVARHALALGPTWHGRTTPGAVVDRVDGDATRLGELLARVVVRMAAVSVTLTAVVVYLGVHDWRLAAALTALIVVAMLLLIRLRDLAVPWGVETRRAVGEVLGTAEERLRGADDLVALDGGRYAVADLHRRSALAIAPTRYHETYATVLWSVTHVIVLGGGVVALGGGILLQRAGAMSIGQVLAAFTATQLLRRPLEQLAGQLQQLQQAASGAARLSELLEEPPLVQFHGQRHLPPGPISIQLQGVDARYPGGEEPALREVCLELPAGAHLGVVGPSGGGKTTLTRLLYRGLDPASGAVLLGGIPLPEVAEADLRDRVAVITQEVQLLSTTVRENLTLLGTLPATDLEVHAALDAVGLGPWLARQPRGLDAVVGDDAGTSAGEAQLLALARVLLRDPGLVVLDEPTARLDTRSALAVTRALEVLLEGRTAVIVAHRLATLERVDRLAVIEGGRIVEAGDRELLVRERGRFAALLAAERGAGG